MKLVALALLAAIGCAKQSPQGLPPAQDRGSGSATAHGPAQPPNDDVHRGMGAVPKDSVHGAPPNDAVHNAPPNDAVHNAPPAAAPTKTLAKLAGNRFALGPYSIAVPKGWTEIPTTSEMRTAQFKVGADAELIVYYFGPDGAGSVKDNVDRWTGQFTPADGKAPEIDEIKLLGQPATLVRTTGHYKAMAMRGMDAVDKADQSLLAAITASPDGPYYWKLVGPKATVAAQRRAFEDLLKGMKLK